MEAVADKDTVNVAVPRDTWKAARVAAIQDDRTLASLVEQALKEYLARRKKT